jgi:3-hydroxyacyl-[acyl-carrier-protein] dehydratase
MLRSASCHELVTNATETGFGRFGIDELATGRDAPVGSWRVSDNSDELVALLPHRPPFRFVDAVDAHKPGSSVQARYCVRGDEEFLTGHFPGNPIFPGVLQLEALAQAGAIALLSDERYAGSLPLFGGVEDVRFRRVVKPGDVMILAVDIERLSRRGGWGRGVATVAGDECCRARMLFVLA